MNRFQLEHVLKAAGAITQQNDLVVIGSQAVLALDSPLDPRLLRSNEADLYPKNAPELADLIDGSIGELSPFHESFGYYAHGVGPETAVAPSGWQSRLVPIRSDYTKDITGWCLEVYDLVISKLVANREKDVAFVKVLFESGYLEREILVKRARTITAAPNIVSRVVEKIDLLFVRC